MRVLLAALFVMAGLCAAVVLLSSLLPERAPAWVIAAVLAPLFFLLCGVALMLFNLPGQRLPGDGERVLRQWEEKGLILSTSYRARRAFQVEEFEDEGSHYFVELDDGSVLYLNGQYLYDYEYDPEAPEHDPEGEQPRRFPCTEFTVRRHRTEGFVIDLQCGGEILEPELVAPPYTDADAAAGRLHTDGEIITDRTYDALKSELLHR
jgi:hypothetical protein